MKIKDLKKYPKLYNRALECQKEQYNEADENESIDEAFSWHKTKEDYVFWRPIFDKDFEKAKQLEPHLFTEDAPSLEGDYKLKETDQVGVYEFKKVGDKPKKFIRVENNKGGVIADYDHNTHDFSVKDGYIQVRFISCEDIHIVFIGSINNFFAYVVESK